MVIALPIPKISNTISYRYVCTIGHWEKQRRDALQCRKKIKLTKNAPMSTIK